MGSVMQVSQGEPTRSEIDEAMAVLAFGGVLVMPTDSVYGIGCAATPGNPAHQRIFAIKKRDLAQTLPWLVADAKDLKRYAAELPAYALKLAISPALLPLTSITIRLSKSITQRYLNTPRRQQKDVTLFFL
jgi:L-threonylcarbamoyladenylate synthase